MRISKLRDCLLAATLLLAPALAQATPNASRVNHAVRSRALSRANPGNARLRADRMSNTFRRASRTSSRAATHFVDHGFVHEMTGMIDGLEHSLTNATVTPAEALRTAAAFARAVMAAREAHPNAGPELAQIESRMERVLGKVRWRARAPRNHTSIEIESTVSDTLLDALTTSDGTVGAFLEERGSEPPDWLVERVGGDARAYAWDDLSRDDRRRLIAEVENIYFGGDLTIGGVHWRRSIRNGTSTSVRLAGRVIRPGEEADVSELLQSNVEARRYARLEGTDTELHLMAPGRASQMLQNARQLGNMLDIASHLEMHQHITTRVSNGILRGDQIEVAQVTDFYRRANVAAEMEMMLAGVQLEELPAQYDFLKASHLRIVHEIFATAGDEGAFSEAYSGVKFAAVGMRLGSAVYGGDNSLFGFEVRSIGYLTPQFADAIQRGLVGRDYGLSRAATTRWYNRVTSRARTARGRREAAGRAFESAYHNRPMADLIEQNAVRLSLTEDERAMLMEQAWNQGLTYLVHDWSNDVALEGQAEVISSIRAAQRTALTELAQGSEARDVLFRFVRRSGLRDAMNASLGL